MDQAIIKHEGEELYVIARDPGEMESAQKGMIEWANRKILTKRKEAREVEENLTIAKKNHWRTTILERVTVQAKKKVEFYEKIRDALKAGYYIVPNMMATGTVFAVRTSKKNPRKNVAHSEKTSWSDGPTPKGQESDAPPSGTGKYVSRDTYNGEKRIDTAKPTPQDPAHKITTIIRWAEEFAEVDFPFTMAKPEIYEATAKAMKEKIFDEIVSVPARKGEDPMVIGVVKFGSGWSAKRVSFLIAWFLDTKDI